MPCSDSSSSLTFRVNDENEFISFEYAKITCGQKISGDITLSEFFATMDLRDILEVPFTKVCAELGADDEETQFVLHLEWDTLRCAIAQYLGIEDPDIDHARCQITSIEFDDDEVTEVALVILPPKELPKILPCSLGEQNK